VPNLVARKFFGVTVNVPGLALNHLPLRVADEVAWLMQRILFGRLYRFGLPRSPEGVATTMARRRQAPAYDDGFVEELRAGRIGIVAAVVGFDQRDVVLADGARIQPDAVIAATGLPPWPGRVGRPPGCPRFQRRSPGDGGQEHPSAAGLFFIGYRVDLSGQLRLMRIDARAIAKAVRRQRAA